MHFNFIAFLKFKVQRKGFCLNEIHLGVQPSDFLSYHSHRHGAGQWEMNAKNYSHIEAMHIMGK